MWKRELQRLADELDIDIRVSHFPPGTSKWNKIEHRLFSFITMNWRGRPLRQLRDHHQPDRRNTTNRVGLVVRARIKVAAIPPATKSPKPKLRELNIERD